jgi:hypothetical protein
MIDSIVSDPHRTLNSYQPSKIALTDTATETSGVAITSLVCVILGFLTGQITGPPAFITGHIARKRIGNSGAILSSSGMALTGLIHGHTSTVVAFTLVFALLIGWIWFDSAFHKPESTLDFVKSAHVGASRSNPWNPFLQSA